MVPTLVLSGLTNRPAIPRSRFGGIRSHTGHLPKTGSSPAPSLEYVEVLLLIGTYRAPWSVTAALGVLGRRPLRYHTGTQT